MSRHVEGSRNSLKNHSGKIVLMLPNGYDIPIYYGSYVVDKKNTIKSKIRTYFREPSNPQIVFLESNAVLSTTNILTPTHNETFASTIPAFAIYLDKMKFAFSCHGFNYPRIFVSHHHVIMGAT